MTFDSRARRASQGIHRAVEVMEMSNTKTPNKLARFDQHRERRSRNQRIAALAVGIAVPVVLLVVALLVLRSDRGPAVPLTPHSVTQTAPSVTPTAETGRTRNFNAPFTYSLTRDWKYSGQGARYFSLEAKDATSKVLVLSDVVPAASDCSARPNPGVGTSVGTSSQAMASWLVAAPAIDATDDSPRRVKLGAATGSYTDVKVAATWHKYCPKGLTLVTGHPDHPQAWPITRGDEERYYFLDTPSGHTVTIVVTAYGGDLQNVIDEAAPVVDSFRFLR